MAWLLLLFSTISSIQLLYYVFIFRKAANHHPLPFHGDDDFPPVSVIICAKNEASNIRENLPSVLHQNYPHFEVVVVNHGSTDGTREVLLDLQQQHDHLKIVDIKPGDADFSTGKRQALSMGLKAAQHDILVLTDADCHATSANWLKLMVTPFLKNMRIAIVAGYAPFNRRKGILNKFQRFENFYTCLTYTGFGLAGFPYMAVGRNLAYKSSLLPLQEYLQSGQPLLSGDDDLAVNRMANRHNIAYQIHPDSWMKSEAESTWTSWIRQKRRHLETGKHYKRHHLFLLGLLNASNLLFYPLIPISMYYFPVQALAFSILVLAVKWWILHRGARKLGWEDSTMWLIPFDFLLPVFMLFLSTSLIRKPQRWK